MDADAVRRRHRVAGVLRSARGVGRAHPRRRLPRRTTRPGRGHAPPRDAGGVLAHVRDRIQRSRAARVLPQRGSHVPLGRTERRPGRASRHHRRRGHLPRVRSHGVVRGVRAAAQGRHDPERRRRHRHRGDRVAPRARSRRRLRDHAERRRAFRPVAAARPGSRVRARARLLLRLGSRRARHVRDRTPRHPGRPAGAARPRARRRAARRRGARGRALPRLLPRLPGPHARRAGAEPVRRARRLGPRRAGHHLQPRVRAARATTRR